MPLFPSIPGMFGSSDTNSNYSSSSSSSNADSGGIECLPNFSFRTVRFQQFSGSAYSNPSFCGNRNSQKLRFTPVYNHVQNSGNILSIARNTKTHGVQFSNVFSSFDDKVSEHVSTHMKRAPEHLKTLCVALQRANLRETVFALQEISSELMSYDEESSASAPEAGSALVQYAWNFDACGGFHVISKIIMERDRLGVVFKGAREGDIAVLLNEAMRILRELSFAVGYILDEEDPSASPELISSVLQLMPHNNYFESATVLAEELLAARSCPVDILDCPKFLDHMMTLSPRHFSYACRVLALLVYDGRDKIESAHFTVQGASSIIETGSRTRVKRCQAASRNQALLFARPEILKRLLSCLHGISSLDSRFAHFYIARGRTQELMTITDVREVFAESAIGQGTVQSVQSAWAAIDALPQYVYDPARETALTFPRRTEPMIGVNIFSLTSHQVEIVFVLCMLTGGKRKSDAIRLLSELGLFEFIHDLMISLNWDPRREPPTQSHPLHGPNCECSTDISLKMQLLRLIHSLLDRDTTNIDVKSTPACKKVVSAVVDILRCQPDDSNYRFWACSCLEAYMRNLNATFQNDISVGCNLLPFLVHDVCTESFKHAGSLQSTFDLLGECLKFNTGLIETLRKYCLKKFGNTSILLTIAKQNLVDSNVFLRSILLDEEFTLKCPTAQVRPELVSVPPSTGAVDETFSSYLLRNRENFLADLMTRVNVDIINQENICCINTTLLFFLPLKSLQQVSDLWNCMPSTARQQFLGLLTFWKGYYFQRGKDRFALEFSTKLSFARWNTTVDWILECGRSTEAEITASSVFGRLSI
eukprot:ANDGO_02745.mRNA.1 hypothetical protein PPTG_02926